MYFFDFFNEYKYKEMMQLVKQKIRLNKQNLIQILTFEIICNAFLLTI